MSRRLPVIHGGRQVLAGPFGAQTAAIPLSALCAACKWGLAAWFALRIGRRVVSKLGV